VVPYDLPEEHLALRDAVRDLVPDKVTPYAAEVDGTATFPRAAYDALLAADLHAVHVPELYGGNGAHALATCLVIEAVARGFAATSLIPAVNQLGSLPVLLAGTERHKQALARAAGSR
jgi:butyryl-CoA dehydrogenase/acyl-CoA dehydrogenase